MQKKIIAIMGAAGSQGWGLLQAILNDPDGDFFARAIITGNRTETNAARYDALKAAEAAGKLEVVVANIEDVESLKVAFAGAYGVYGVTFFWAHFSPEKENQGAKNIAEAAKAAGVQHVIWSTLEDTRNYVPVSDTRMPTLQGKYKVPHFDAKGEVDHVFTDLGLPVTFLLTSFYWDNMYMFKLGAPIATPDGTHLMTLPMGDKKLYGIASEDIGACAYGIFKAGPKYIGKRVGIAGEALTVAEMATKVSVAMNINAKYNPVTPDQFRGFGFPGAEDLGNMFQVYAEFEKEIGDNRDMNLAKELNPGLKTFGQWLEVRKGQIPTAA